MKIVPIETHIDARVLASVLYQVTEGETNDTHRLLEVLSLEEFCEVYGILKQFLPEFLTPKIRIMYYIKTKKRLH